jgi:catechol 2,3-dioxygenase-like lactoylglutathione lyase family enzyme
MELEAAYPVVVTDRLAECRAFYTQRLGFERLRQAGLSIDHPVSA